MSIWAISFFDRFRPHKQGAVGYYLKLEVLQYINGTVLVGQNHQWFWLNYHGLYGRPSISCISHGPCQWERAIFDPHSSETHGPLFTKLEIYNYFPHTTQHAKFQGATSTWAVLENSQFDAWKFLSFFRFFATPTGRIPGRTPARNTSLYVVLAKVVPFGG